MQYILYPAEGDIGQVTMTSDNVLSARNSNFQMHFSSSQNKTIAFYTIEK